MELYATFLAGILVPPLCYFAGICAAQKRWKDFWGFAVTGAALTGALLISAVNMDKEIRRLSSQIPVTEATAE